LVKPENDARQSARCEQAFATADLPRRKSSEVISHPVPANDFSKIVLTPPSFILLTFKRLILVDCSAKIIEQNE
jgi:hypothetical protein